MDVIKRSIRNVMVPNQSRGAYWYFYALIMDNKPCAKLGKTERKLDERIHKYLMIEHRDQPKDMSTFKLIAVMDFENAASIKHVEGLIKTEMKKYPLNVGQHHNTEQYQLNKAWEILSGFLKRGSFPFAKKTYLVANADEEIRNICSLRPRVVEKVIPMRRKKVIGIRLDDDKLLQIINRMSQQAFRKIHGIGETLSKRLYDFSPYSSLSAIMKVKGIGTSKYIDILDYVKENYSTEKLSSS